MQRGGLIALIDLLQAGRQFTRPQLEKTADAAIGARAMVTAHWIGVVLEFACQEPR
jgi:hypothetical protein